MMYEHVGKKNNNLFSTLWCKGAILLAEICGMVVRNVRNGVEDGGFGMVVHVDRFF
jgi:hypothetical protein